MTRSICGSLRSLPCTCCYTIASGLDWPELRVFDLSPPRNIAAKKQRSTPPEKSCHAVCDTPGKLSPDWMSKRTVTTTSSVLMLNRSSTFLRRRFHGPSL